MRFIVVDGSTSVDFDVPREQECCVGTGMERRGDKMKREGDRCGSSFYTLAACGNCSMLWARRAQPLVRKYSCCCTTFNIAITTWFAKGGSRAFKKSMV